MGARQLCKDPHDGGQAKREGVVGLVGVTLHQARESHAEVMGVLLAEQDIQEGVIEQVSVSLTELVFVLYRVHDPAQEVADRDWLLE